MIGLDFQPLGDFLVAHSFDAAETEGFGLAIGQLGQGETQMVAQFGRLGFLLGQWCVSGCLRRCRHRLAATSTAIAISQKIDRPGGRHLSQQRGPLLDSLAASDLDRVQKHLLETIRCVGVVAQQPVGRLPDDVSVLLDDLPPICHLLIPAVVAT